MMDFIHQIAGNAVKILQRFASEGLSKKPFFLAW